MSTTPLNPDSLLPLYINNSPSHAAILRPQLQHRINLIQNIWHIPPGSQILEIGCGQGDCTLVLAAAIGPDGHVDAVDPCPLDYGAPATVGAAQSFLKKGALGERITFIQADPTEHLASCKKTYDYAVLNNCLWYFDSPTRISELLSLLLRQEHAKKILIAEWSLEARSLAQVPHVLAALFRGNREFLDPGSRQNIRTVVSPGWIRRWFAEQGVAVVEDRMVECPEGMMDGRWEVMSLLGESFMEETRGLAGCEAQVVALEGMRDAVIQAVGRLENGVHDVRCMMIWTVMV